MAAGGGTVVITTGFAVDAERPPSSVSVSLTVKK
jgi:hypothetical protein